MMEWLTNANFVNEVKFNIASVERVRNKKHHRSAQSIQMVRRHD